MSSTERIRSHGKIYMYKTAKLTLCHNPILNGARCSGYSLVKTIFFPNQPVLAYGTGPYTKNTDWGQSCTFVHLTANQKKGGVSHTSVGLVLGSRNSLQKSSGASRGVDRSCSLGRFPFRLLCFVGLLHYFLWTMTCWPGYFV